MEKEENAVDSKIPMYKVEFFLLKSSCVLTSYRKSRRNCLELGLVRAARAGNVKLGRLGVGLDVGALLGVRRSLVVNVCAQIGKVSARSLARGAKQAEGTHSAWKTARSEHGKNGKGKKIGVSGKLLSRPLDIRHQSAPRTSGSQESDTKSGRRTVSPLRLASLSFISRPPAWLSSP